MFPPLSKIQESKYTNLDRTPRIILLRTLESELENESIQQELTQIDGVIYMMGLNEIKSKKITREIIISCTI